MTTKLPETIPTLTTADLVPFGVEALAAILVDCAGRDIDLLDRLRLSVAARKGPSGFAAMVASCIQALIDDHTFYDWRTAGTLADRIEYLSAAIADGFDDPAFATKLLGDLVATSDSVMNTVDDSSGRVGGAFGAAIGAWGVAWAKSPDRDTDGLAALVLHEIASDNYGVKSDVLPAFIEALGPAGLITLRGLVQSEIEKDAASCWGWHISLQQIADGLGDVDGFIAAVEMAGYPERQAVDVAGRLVAAKRADEALEWLDRADTSTGQAADVRIDALLALGREEDAQALRWSQATDHLRIEHYRVFANALPTEDRGAAHERAVAAAMDHDDAVAALVFLRDLPDEAAAERLVTASHPDLNGCRYSTLLPVAEGMADRHPLAALLLYRVLAEAVLDAGRSPAYHHAADYICIASGLGSRIDDWQGHETQDKFMARIRDAHRRKSAFWPAFARAEQGKR